MFTTHFPQTTWSYTFITIPVRTSNPTLSSNMSTIFKLDTVELLAVDTVRCSPHCKKRADVLPQKFRAYTTFIPTSCSSTCHNYLFVTIPTFTIANCVPGVTNCTKSSSKPLSYPTQIFSYCHHHPELHSLR
jgi:hypothetical protein